MIEVQPPSRRYPLSGNAWTLFLAGSIEMGAAEDWQRKVINALKENTLITHVFNPRRADWNSSWEQDISHPEFNAQVNWELDMIERVGKICFYFAPGTISPITLLELGKVLETMAAESIYVCCPRGFHRRGNVEISCERHGVAVIETLDELIEIMVSDFTPQEVGASWLKSEGF